MKSHAKKKIGRRKRVGEKIKFPRFRITEAVDIARKAVKKYGTYIIPYSEFARIIGVKSPKGGSYQIKIEALKLYGLMDRHSFKEIALLDKGKQILAATEAEATELMFENVLAIPIMKKLYERYEENLPLKRKPIVDYLVNVEGMDRREAGRLTGVFIKDYKFFQPLIPGYVVGIEVMPAEEEKPSIEVPELYSMIRIMASLFPLDVKKEDIKNKLDILSTLAKKYGYKTFYGFIEGLKPYADDPEELRKNASRAIEFFEQDTGIKLRSVK